jgi:hypothetical protein
MSESLSKDQVRSLNAAQCGSLGERIVTWYFNDLGIPVRSVHKDFVDLEIGGVLFDVKARRWLDHPYPQGKAYPFRGKEHRRDVEYIHLVFFNQAIVLSDKSTVLKRWHWEDIPAELMVEPKEKTGPGGLKKPGHAKDLQSDLREWYKGCTAGGKLYFYYRGPASKGGWGPEQAPDNSYPTKKRLNTYRAEVFCQYSELSSTEGTIEYLIAFPHSNVNDLPRGPVSNRQMKKGIVATLGLSTIVAKCGPNEQYEDYVFSSVTELKSEFFKRFPPNANEVKS